MKIKRGVFVMPNDAAIGTVFCDRLECIGIVLERVCLRDSQVYSIPRFGNSRMSLLVWTDGSVEKYPRRMLKTILR